GVRAPAPERAPDDGRHLPRPADQLMHDCGCKDYSRTELLQRAAAGTAAGVPEFDPRMPVPAGAGLDRRSFLLRSLGVAVSVYGAGHLGWGAFEEGIAKAAAGPAQPVLVSI